ncbi:MAG: hypothetical protein WAL56_09560 [Candidatus Sulfotelmatobacter sp.]
MRRNRQRLTWLGVSILAVLVLAPVLLSQTAPQAARPVVTDWSSRHVISRLERNPRYTQQRIRTEPPTMAPAMQERASELETAVRAAQASASGKSLTRDQLSQSFSPQNLLRHDWQEDLGSGASVGAGNYPAKYSFYGTTANCGNATQPDFVVYSTGLAGSTGQASVVAYDNLYSGCTGTVPSVYWAYNTGGQILTSPSFSRDGTQVAFVETSGGFGILVLLKWATSTTETVSAPDTLTAVSNAAYRACVAPCMTKIDLEDHSGTQTDDTTSSVFADISDDTAWVGGAGGWLHKITGIFLGTPAESTGGAFPVQVNPGNPNVLTSPVHDYASGNVYVGDAGGFLYSVNSSTGAVIQSGQLDFGVGIVEGPIVDSANGFVYAFASSDGSSNCAGGAACSAVYQLSTSFLAGDLGTEATVGASVVFGTLPNPNPLYIGSFDSAYQKSTAATGNLYVCGNTGSTPILYQVPIVAGVLPASGVSITLLTSTLKTPPCSPVTDIYNANASGGATEKLFVSVQSNGLNTGCGGGGCLFNFVDTPWQPQTAYIVGQEILALSPFDNQLFVNVATFPGTSGATPPNWPDTPGNGATDGTVHWVNQGNLSAAALSTWPSNHLYTRPNPRIVDSNGNVEIVNTAGTTGGSPPTWSTTPGVLTTDGTVTWINAGVLGSFVLPAAGGTSGIIIDNTVGSGTLPGASQVYFSTLSDQVCGTSGTGGCAVQASQSDLQ